MYIHLISQSLHGFLFHCLQQVKHNCIKGLLKRFQALSEGNRELVDYKNDQISIEKRLALADDKTNRIKNAIAGLRLKHSKYDEVFKRVLILVGGK